MKRRGTLIRTQIPSALRDSLADFTATLGIVGADLEVEGRDGTGPKSEIPWVRLYSASRSPSAHIGWYCVYLFCADGSGFYLAIGHAATRYINDEFKPRPAAELASLMAWAREALSDVKAGARPLFADGIDLKARGKLGPSYERGTIWSRFYSASAVPSEEELLADLKEYLRVLSHLYDLDDLGRSVTNSEEQVTAAESAVASISAPERASRQRGQGFGLSPEERRAVERRAMKVAGEHLIEAGFQIEDVSAKRPFDFVAAKDGETYIVEVKGTTAGPHSILLTANEVAAHREKHPFNMLIIVHSIALERQSTPKASGGSLHIVKPWELKETSLVAIAFKYALD